MPCGMRTASDGTHYWMPECIGGAAMGLGYCTCRTESGRRRRAKESDDKIARMEHEIAELRERVFALEAKTRR